MPQDQRLKMLSKLCLARTGLSPVGSLLASWRAVWWTSHLQMRVTLSNGRLQRWPSFPEGFLSGSWIGLSTSSGLWRILPRLSGRRHNSGRSPSEANSRETAPSGFALLCVDCGWQPRSLWQSLGDRSRLMDGSWETRMNRATIERRLREVEQHIARGENTFTRQDRIIAEFQRGKQDGSVKISSMRNSQRQLDS
jgi:hypothetical protein